MSIRTLVGILALCTVVVFSTDTTVRAVSVSKAVINTIGSMGKSKYKIQTSGAAKPDRDMFKFTIYGLTLASGDRISISIEGADDTVELGDPAAPSLRLTDPKGKGKSMKSDKGALLDGFKAKGRYKFANDAKGKASKLTINLKKAGAGGVIELTPAGQKNVARTLTVTVHVLQASDGQVVSYVLPGQWLITRKVKAKNNTNTIKAKTL